MILLRKGYIKRIANFLQGILVRRNLKYDRTTGRGELIPVRNYHGLGIHILSGYGF